MNCVNLKTVKFYKMVNVIGVKAFYGCTSLSIDLRPMIFLNGSFGCSGVTSVVVSQSILDEAFMNCQKLKNVTLNGVMAVSRRAFFGCKGIEKVIVKANSLDEGCFQNCNICTLVIEYVQEINLLSFKNSVVDVIEYRLNVSFPTKLKLFNQKPMFVFPYGVVEGNIFGYEFRKNNTTKIHPIIIGLSTSAVVLVLILVFVILYLVKKRKVIQDRLELDQIIINDFG